MLCYFLWPFRKTLNNEYFGSRSCIEYSEVGPLTTILTKGPTLFRYAIVAKHVDSNSPRMRTYFFDSQAEIGSYFKGTETDFNL